ncbi:UvrD-helicase domain-containing protein [Aeromonas veronii]|uniref:UvrD-helicase domain-containing protein n=1 Tax=Aeromonas veronii TaxID=654 RepID=UPI003BA13D69
MNTFKFTPDQLAAINSKSSMVITACPGSGKTAVIVEKIRNEVKCLPSYQGVIGITFTVKASKELKKRCKINACDTKASFFGTIDNFCLSEIIYPFLSRSIEKDNHQLECVKFNDLPQSIRDKLKTIPNYDGYINSDLFSHFEDDIKTLFDHGFILLELLGLLANYVIEKSISCQKYIKAKYCSAYVDEYQDSSELQHSLFMNLFKLGLKCIAVGDVQQSIYAWRNSDPKFINELMHTPEKFEHHIINFNHRCHPSIINYSNRLYNETCPLLPTDEVRVYRWNIIGTQIEITQQINNSIGSVIKEKIVSSYSDIGILVRNNLTLDFLSNGLNVPFRVFDEDPLAARSTDACALFNQLLKYRFDSNHHLYDVVEHIKSFRKIKRNNLPTIRTLISSINDKHQIDLSSTIIKITKELLESNISISDEELIKSICLDSKLLKHYKPIDKNEVQVMTLHKSKGLEFDLVYHLDLYDWIHPKRVFTPGCWDVVFDNWEQELNLHYVGVTRAKNYCILITSNTRINNNHETKQGNPSQFLSLPGLNGLYN